MLMMKHKSFSILPVQICEPILATQDASLLPNTSITEMHNPSLITATPTAAPAPTARRDMASNQHHQHHRQNGNHLAQYLSVRSTSKLAARGSLRQHQRQHYQHHSQNPQNSRPKVIRASEYRNLRQVVPSLRRQRDVGKVEVVTEAARYIDHLHKTLIERFVLCGIPDSLKDILGTNDANELNSQHIKNLVTRMARQQQQQHNRQARATAQPSVALFAPEPRTISSRNGNSLHLQHLAQMPLAATSPSSLEATEARGSEPRIPTHKIPFYLS